MSWIFSRVLVSANPILILSFRKASCVLIVFLITSTLTHPFDQIKDLLDYIESRLAELQEEKEELKEFQEKDKERRWLEYALYQWEVDGVGGPCRK